MGIFKRVLFLYIQAASGHQRAAEAVMNAVHQMSPRVQGHGVDSMSYAYPIAGKIVARLYLQVLKYTPQIWDFLYDNPTIEEATREIRELMHLFNVGKIYRLFKRYRPRCLVCTQALPASILATLKQRGKIKLPLIGIVTDYGVHNYWISRHVDLYMVPTDDIKHHMIRRGIKESHILVTGIPIDPAFSVPHNKRTEKQKLGFDPDKPVALVMGGNHGLGPMDKVVAALRALPLGLQVIMVCGNNRKLLKEMSEEFASDGAVRILGHTKSVPKIMDTADVLISKPGGLTSAESMAKGLPMIMIHPIPGQEERNAQYLMKHGAAERAETLEELTNAVERLFTHPEQLAKLRERAMALAKPQAAFDAAEAILRIIKEPVISRPLAGGEKTRNTVPPSRSYMVASGSEESRVTFTF